MALCSTTNPTSARRMQMDVNRLLSSEYEVKVDHDMSKLFVKFHGPADTPYEGGVWAVSVHMSKDYPFKPPLIKFSNKIFHPNIEFSSGAVCMNVFQEAWSPLYDLLNIFEIFLPQLLRNPNPSDPLNQIAANLLDKSPKGYSDRIKELVVMYALPKKVPRLINATAGNIQTAASNNNNKTEEERSSSSDVSLSDLESDNDNDNENNAVVNDENSESNATN